MSSTLWRAKTHGYQNFPLCLSTAHLFAISKSRKVIFLRYIEKSREQNNNECLFLWHTPVHSMTVSFNWALVSFFGGGDFLKKNLLILQKLACLFPNLWDSASICTFIQPSLSCVCVVPNSFLHIVQNVLSWLSL